MKRPSTKQKILYFLQAHRDWTPLYDIEAQASNFQAMASQISRRCRELRESGVIESRMKDGYVEYRLKALLVGTAKPQPQSEQLFNTDDLIRRKVIY